MPVICNTTIPPATGNPYARSLVLTKSPIRWECHDDVVAISTDNIARFLEREGGSAQHAIVDPTVWLSADYSPLPSLITAARTIFNHEPLPHIRRARSAGIDDAIASLNSIAYAAKSTNQRHLALITGVPGAGKTLVGLQFVYENEFDRSRNTQRTRSFSSPATDHSPKSYNMP